MAEQKGKHQQDDFVAKIVKDPKNPPNVILMSGFLGASSESGYTRLYFDTQLSSYVEIPNDAILYSQAKSKEESALGGSYVWINRDTELIHGKVSAERTKGKFFEGPIFQEYFRAGSPVPGGFEAEPVPLSQWGPACRTVSIRNCKTIYPVLCTAPPCPTSSGPCITPVVACIPTPQDIPRLDFDNYVTKDYGHGCPERFETIAEPKCNQIEMGLNYQARQNMTISGIQCTSQWGPCWSNFGPNCQTQFICPTRFKCPTRNLIPCPTPFCPTQPPGCGTFGPNCQTHLCPQTPFCPNTQLCPQTNFCPETQACPQTPFCPSIACPSAVDACPSALGCFDPGMNYGGWR